MFFKRIAQINLIPDVLPDVVNLSGIALMVKIDALGPGGLGFKSGYP